MPVHPGVLPLPAVRIAEIRNLLSRAPPERRRDGSSSFLPALESLVFQPVPLLLPRQKHPARSHGSDMSEDPASGGSFPDPSHTVFSSEGFHGTHQVSLKKHEYAE